MARLAINAGKGNRTKVPTPGISASFVKGSQPAGLRAPPVPRIKPGNTREYGKGLDANPAGASFGNTSLTSRS